MTKSTVQPTRFARLELEQKMKEYLSNKGKVRKIKRGESGIQDRTLEEIREGWAWTGY